MPSTTEIFDKIKSHLTGSKAARVVITTYTRSTAYAPKHLPMFRLSSSGSLQVQSGKRWETIAEPTIGPLVSIRFGEYK